MKSLSVRSRPSARVWRRRRRSLGVSGLPSGRGTGDARHSYRPWDLGASRSSIVSQSRGVRFWDTGVAGKDPDLDLLVRERNVGTDLTVRTASDCILVKSRMGGRLASRARALDRERGPPERVDRKDGRTSRSTSFRPSPFTTVKVPYSRSSPNCWIS